MHGACRVQIDRMEKPPIPYFPEIDQIVVSTRENEHKGRYAVEVGISGVEVVLLLVRKEIRGLSIHCIKGHLPY